MKQRMRISRGGQVSIPASIRRRWGTSVVSLVDLGDRIVLAPEPEDPIAAAEGALAEFAGIEPARLRKRAREDDRDSVRRRSG